MNFYRPTTAEDFPLGLYFQNKTKTPVKNYFQSHDYPCDVKDLEKFCIDRGANQIHSATQQSSYTVSTNLIWEFHLDSLYYCLVATSWFTRKKIKEPTRTKNYLRENFFDDGEEKRTNVTLMTNAPDDVFNQLMGDLKDLFTEPKGKPNQISLVVQGTHGYDTVPFDLPKNEINLPTNYGEDFVKVHERVITELERPNGKGLVLLHGTPGTGKTYYLKHLASLIKNKEVLFIPPYLADMITSPDMMPFLVEMKDSILFIEDAEKVISDRVSGNSVGVSNILNLTDGILSDILNIQIVATFNMDIGKIDEALLRKGRLIAQHEFKELDVEQSNKLLKELKSDYITEEPMTLTQIYNVKEEEFKTKKKDTKIGFG
jgi:hypothetical protein